MGRKKIYATPEEAYQAKLEKARARYHLKKGTEQRKKWGFINLTITEDMIGKTIKDVHAEYRKRQEKNAEEEDSPVNSESDKE